MNKPHVLDILAQKQGCFVSDLRLNPVNRRKALADLLLLDDSAFRLKEWKETVYYLTRTTRIFDDVSLVKRYIRMYLLWKA